MRDVDAISAAYAEVDIGFGGVVVAGGEPAGELAGVSPGFEDALARGGEGPGDDESRGRSSSSYGLGWDDLRLGGRLDGFRHGTVSCGSVCLRNFSSESNWFSQKDPVEGKPVGGVLERSDGEAAHADAADLLLRDETGFFEDAQVLHDRGHGDGVRTGEFGDGGLTALESGQDAAARGVAESGEGGVERG